ncbi:MAG: DUF1385 domain-containing protein [Oscillospiraceae bacterium]|nr:DUF1385 domain-containing protein [Oscillospiraceae bacterium]
MMAGGGEPRKESIGGSALIEGLMMIGPEYSAMAIRKPNGEVHISREKLPPKSVLTKVPIVRGVIGFAKQIAMSTKSLMESASFMEEGPAEAEAEGKIPAEGADPVEAAGEGTAEGAGPAAPETPATPDRPAKPARQAGGDAVIYVSVAISVILVIGLFFILPNFLAGLIGFDKGTRSGAILYNLTESAIKVAMFLAYLWLASLLKDIKRVWQYHGAEHKAINCHEGGEELTTENVRRHSVRHRRCGTSFMFLVIFVSVLFFSLLPLRGTLFNIVIRVLLAPLVAGVSYEALRFAGRSDGVFSRVISMPGLAFQRLTTKEPDDLQIEVGIAAFNAARSDYAGDVGAAGADGSADTADAADASGAADVVEAADGTASACP